MNRMIRMMSAVMLVGGLAACHDDPTVPLTSTPADRIQASPQVMFVNQNTPKVLLLRLTNDANYSTPTGPYTVTGVAPGITVVWDSLYRPDYVGTDSLTAKPVKSQHRYYVTASSAQTSTFTVAAGSISQVITVTVVPTTLGPALSATAPAIGDPVTITAPSNLSFNVDSSEVTFADADDPVITDITATTITFIPQPGSSGPATVTKVNNNYSTAVGSKSLTTSNSIEVPSIPQPVLDDTSPALGQPITVTAGAGTNFASDATVTFAAGGGDALITGQTATTLTFLPAPGSEGAASVDGVVLTTGQGDLLGSYTVQSSEPFASPVPDLPFSMITGAFSNAAPAPGTTVTFSAAGFKFLPNVTVDFNGAAAAVVAITADSSTITILPPLGVDAKVATINNVAVTAYGKLPIPELPTSATLTTSDTYVAAALPNTNPLAGAADPAAPVLTVGSSGAGLFDGGAWTGSDAIGGGGSNRIYKIVVTEARAYTISVGWASGTDADLDIFLYSDPGLGDDDAVDDSAGSANPEVLADVELEPGNYYLVVVNWHDQGTPDNISVVVQ